MEEKLLENLELEAEEITIRGKELKIFKPKRLEDVFQGDPFFEVEKFPFWFKIWEGSIILADYLATLKPPKKILELGAGLGVPSLVASSFGHEVIASDYELLPLKLIELSAKANTLKVKTMVLDWKQPQLYEKFDLIVGAEVIFKTSLFEPLLELFIKFLNEKGEIILAHSSERKRILIPFLYKAQQFFEVLTSIRKLKTEDEVIEIVLNKLLPKKDLIFKT
ncbi:MAG: protein N-lysine methyltransferase family protein [Thermodesulfobacteriaceae bacterium]|nr:protein N-lysine methyltransferase family protein [Thermodesulfobacteriaceae bacterium]MDW8135991.1 methyltransferase [Thermodesulfobacterium sp.]